MIKIQFLVYKIALIKILSFIPQTLVIIALKITKHIKQKKLQLILWIILTKLFLINFLNNNNRIHNNYNQIIQKILMNSSISSNNNNNNIKFNSLLKNLISPTKLQ